VAALVETVPDVCTTLKRVEPPDQQRLMSTLFAQLDADLNTSELFGGPPVC
jgi:hypothetical protein